MTSSSSCSVPQKWVTNTNMVRILKSSRKWHMLALPSFVTGCLYFGFEPNRGRQPWSFSSEKSTKRAGTIRGSRCAGFTRRSFGSKPVSARKIVGWETGGGAGSKSAGADTGVDAVAAAATAAAGLDTGTAYLRCASGLDAAAPMKRRGRRRLCATLSLRGDM
eukprot:scaffold2564_cov65-Phaeocystis_antarctica.AAC.2